MGVERRAGCSFCRGFPKGDISMGRRLAWLGLAVLLAMVLRATGADEKKKPASDEKKSDKKAEPKKSEYVAFGRAFIAVVTSLDDKTVKMVGRFPVRGAVQERELEYDLADDAKIRIEVLPPKVDDDGKKVKRTAEELKELKGKGDLWGYTGSAENLQPGRIVRVFLGKKRGADKEDPPLITQIQVAKMPGDDKVEAG